MSRDFRKPPVASWPVWKVAAIGLGGSTLWVFFIWLFNLIPSLHLTGIPRPLTIGDILLGSGWLLIGFWTRWTYQPNLKHARWHRWLESLTVLIYIFGLMLGGAINYWNAFLNAPWNRIVNSVLVMLFATALLLPFISYPIAKKIAEMQWVLSFRMLSCGGMSSLMVLAGIIGANFGINSYRNSKLESAIFVMSVLLSLLAVFLAQFGAEHLWRYRPWAKEEE